MPLPPSTHSTSFSLIIYSSSLGSLSLVNDHHRHSLLAPILARYLSSPRSFRSCHSLALQVSLFYQCPAVPSGPLYAS